MSRAGFLLDLHRCVGCGACVLACRIENGRVDTAAWRRVLSLNLRRHPAGPTYFLSVASGLAGKLGPVLYQTPPYLKKDLGRLREFLGTLHPRRDIYLLEGGAQPMTIPGVRSTIEDDLYVLLVDWEPIGVDGATFKVYVNPLINWVWAGGLVFILGTLVAVWPSSSEARRAVTLQVAATRTAGD